MASISEIVKRYSRHPLIAGAWTDQRFIAGALPTCSIFIYEYVVVPAKLDQYFFEPITHFLLLAVKQYLTSPKLIAISLIPWVGGSIYDHIIVPRFLSPSPKFIVNEPLPVDDSPHPTHLPVRIEAEKLNPDIETCPFVISMKVGKEWSVPPSMNVGISPTQEIYLMANWAKSKAIIPDHRFLSVHAELENVPGCSLTDGYRELGQHVASLGRKVPFERWGQLSVCLPTEPDNIQYPSSSYELLPIPAHQLRNLRWLTWSGRREQLASPSSWLPFSEPLLRPLINLTLTCEISLEDFSRILFCGAQLQNLEVHSIDFKASSVLGCLPGELSSLRNQQRDNRPNLESLNVTSSQDISPVLSRYAFPALRRINFNLSYKKDIMDLVGVPWAQLREVVLKCYLPAREHSEWVQRACPIYARHDHFHINTLYKLQGLP
ncbi:hypothetical protein H0H81_008751 [Sphagnurus paluster]|uniref:Uncharacterized protein n=1 Tax=Sphagnurus paluster TaxID=117069 RepID=A0A9P7FW74_9AGAR|nr:hypothetical protein H0H81_008751 [Sphagnurus paluster]